MEELKVQYDSWNFSEFSVFMWELYVFFEMEIEINK